jgi:hypothetical protein
MTPLPRAVEVHAGCVVFSRESGAVRIALQETSGGWGLFEETVRNQEKLAQAARRAAGLEGCEINARDYLHRIHGVAATDPPLPMVNHYLLLEITLGARGAGGWSWFSAREAVARARTDQLHLVRMAVARAEQMLSQDDEL